MSKLYYTAPSDEISNEVKLTTPEKSVEEIVNDIPYMACGCYDPDCENRTYKVSDITQTLQAERQKRDEMYKAGLERAVEVAEEIQFISDDLGGGYAADVYDIKTQLQAEVNKDN